MSGRWRLVSVLSPFFCGNLSYPRGGHIHVPTLFIVCKIVLVIYMAELLLRRYVNSICDRKTDDLRPQSLKYNTVIS